MERIIIDSGGQVLVKGTPTPRQIYIQSGTENNSITMSYTRNPFLDSAVQGSQYYCWYRDPNNTYTQLGSSIFTNTLQFTSGESGYIDPIYSQPGTVINNWTLVADTVHAWDQVAHLDCNITVLSGGTFTQGLAAQMGYWRYDYNVDNSHKEFRAYPGAVVIIERRNGYSDSFEDSYNVNISNETDLTFYRITSSSTIEPYSVYYYGIPYATICVTSNFSSNSAEWPNIQNITGATWSDYAEQTDPFAVHSEPVRESRSFVPGVYPNYMQIVNSGFTVKLFNNMGLAQYQYVSSGGQEPEPIPLQYGLNVIPVAFNTLTGITCITDYGEALYTKTETAGTWAKDISGGASLPATLYTSADSPISGDAVYSDSAKVTSVGVVRGFDYPLISGSTVTIQDSPTMGAFYSYDGADLLYRCSIADMVVITANGGAVSHYKEFRVRQFYEDPGKLY